MGFSKELYRQALEEKKRMRERAEAQARRRKEQAYAALPRLGELDRQLGAYGAKLALSALSGADLSAQREACQALSDQKEKLLREAGWKPEDFLPAYACAQCGDTGRQGDSLCGCVHRLVRKLAYEQLSAQIPLEACRFDNFDLRYYPNGGDGSPRRRMEGILGMCRKYADGFSLASPNLLFLGKTGLGKTHLSLAIARTVLEKGYGVIYNSVQDLLGQAERERFGRAPEGAPENILETAMACDLLILDDLGTEFSSPFNLSAINQLVSGRLLAGRPTVINTNLSLKELEERYQPRVTSRILGNYSLREFLGNDVRQIKKMQGMGLDAAPHR